MNNTLIVTIPFSVLELGDKLELSKDGKCYVCETNESFDNSNDYISCKYHAKFEISKESAETLIKSGHLKPEKETKTEFKNIFDEIDNLLNKYDTELKNVDVDYKNVPECVKVEKITVLSNIITVLIYLKSLRKNNGK